MQTFHYWLRFIQWNWLPSLVQVKMSLKKSFFLELPILSQWRQWRQAAVMWWLWSRLSYLLFPSKNGKHSRWWLVSNSLKCISISAYRCCKILIQFLRYCHECMNKATGERNCLVCGKRVGKNLVLCELCPRAYHTDCHNPVMPKVT